MQTFLEFNLLTCLTFLLSGCYPNTYIETTFQNDTNFDLLVVEHWYRGEYELKDSSSVPYHLDTHLIASGTEEILRIKSGEVWTLTDFDTCLDFREEIIFLTSEVVGHDSLSVQTDINDIDEWEFTVREERREGSGSCECRLTIDNTEIN